MNQSAPNLVKIYMAIRSWMSLIMGLIGFERLELFALELEKLPHLTLFTLSIYNYYPFGTKLNQNIYGHTVSDEFDYGHNRIRTSGVICR